MQRYKAVFAVVAVVLSLVPMVLVAHYPFVDYPNHLARLEIYKRLPSSQYLASFYEWKWAIIPNLAVDLLAIPFTFFLSVEQSANAVILLSSLLLCLGTIQLDRELHGERWGLAAFSGLLVYNGALRYGFVNYVVAVSFAMAAFALWVRCRPRLGPVQLLLFVPVGMFLVLMHLYAFGLYAICVASYEFSLFLERKPWERWTPRGLAAPVSAAASLVLPLGLLLASPTSADAKVTIWSTPLWKMEALLAPVFFNQPWVELPLYAALLAFVGLGLLTGTLRIHRRMIPAMVAFGVLVLLMPRMLLGSNYADYRLLPGASFFFLASLEFIPNRQWMRSAALAVLGICLVVRIGSVTGEWLSAQPVIAEYDEAFAHVRPGAKVLVVRGSRGSTSANRRPPLEHVPAFAAAKREAFVAYTFTGAPVALQLRPEYKSYWQFSPYPEVAADMARFDYVLAVDNPDFAIPDGLILSKLASGRTYVLSEVGHGERRDAAPRM